MTVAQIKRLLEDALLRDGPMVQALYEFELEEALDTMRESLERDHDDYLFTVTVNRGHVAMALIEASGDLHINEQARARLQALWRDAYEGNIKRLLPAIAKQLHGNEIPLNGVKVQRHTTTV